MNLSMAPIQGMTTAFYRNTFAWIFGGIDEYFSPFIGTASVKKINPSLLKDLFIERNDASIKLIPQLLSNNGTDFRTFARAIVDMGYNEINWNIGCPFPMVTKKKKGSGILPHPDMIDRFLDTACADNSYNITVKMRLGLDDPGEGIRVIQVLNKYPLGGVIIHPRTGLQMYTGKADLDSFGILARSSKHKITYNGDIFTYDDFIRISTCFPFIENFMLGRGALRDPFLPSTIKGEVIPPNKKLIMFRDFHNVIFEHHKNTLFGERHLCDKMKEFWTYVSVPLDKDGKLMKRIKKCHNSNEYLQIVNNVLSSSSPWSDSPLK